MTEDIEKWEARHSEEDTLPAVNQPNNFIQVIERLASRPEVDVEKLERIMQMQEHILDRDAEKAFNAAMTKAQNRIELVVADAENKQTNSKYAMLKTVLLKAKPVYTEEGFSLMFYEGECPKENHKRVCVDVMHNMGHTMKGKYVDVAIQTTGIAGKSMMTQIHGEGSAFSYGRRYLTCMIFNIPTGDDDGNMAGSEPVEYINDQNFADITTLIQEVGANEKAFCKYLKIESLDKMPASMYERAVKELERKRK